MTIDREEFLRKQLHNSTKERLIEYIIESHVMRQKFDERYDIALKCYVSHLKNPSYEDFSYEEIAEYAFDAATAFTKVSDDYKTDIK